MKIPSVVHPTWGPLLQDTFNGQKMANLRTFLQSEKAIPHGKDVFRAFQVPVDKLRVVLVGQDPYPDPSHATGIAFGIPGDCTSVPFSLRIIEKELGHPIADKTLQSWVDQGMLLLNSALTTKPFEPGCHIDRWDFFIRMTLYSLSSARAGLIFLLWGKTAGTFKDVISHNGHYVFQASHPASEKYKPGSFLGCNHFTKVNKALLNMKQEPLIF